jgi:uncharacterized protein
VTTAWLLLIMAAVGVVAGVLNYAAAGGSLLPFLVLSLLGIPPLVANATTLAATPLSFVRVFCEVKDVPRVMMIPLVFSAGATAVGVWFVAHLVPSEIFRDAVPVLLIVSVVFLLRFRRIKNRINASSSRDPLSPRATVIVLTSGFTLTSVYAGAFGGGVAVAILAIGSSATAWPWQTLNTAKNVLCLTTSVVGLIAYAPTGLVIWPLCLVVGVFMVLGSLIGKWVTNRVPDNTQRLIVAVVTVISASYLWAAH